MIGSGRTIVDAARLNLDAIPLPVDFDLCSSPDELSKLREHWRLHTEVQLFCLDDGTFAIYEPKSKHYQVHSCRNDEEWYELKDVDQHNQSEDGSLYGIDKGRC